MTTKINFKVYVRIARKILSQMILPTKVYGPYFDNDLISFILDPFRPIYIKALVIYLISIMYLSSDKNVA